MIESLRHRPDLWDLFTRREEYGATALDRYGRFPYYRSRHRDVAHPTVSAYLIEQGLQVRYPEGKPFAVCLTHDIDNVRYNLWHWAYEIALALRRRRAGTAGKLILHRLSRRINPLWNFARTMELEARYGAKSTFFFLALDRGEEDFSFRIGELTDLLREISRRGWEVGLHGGHKAWRDRDALRRQKDRLEHALGQEVTGYRNHYLRFSTPTTWRLLAEAGFAYDSTFGYADCVGFRNGMCHPFRPFDFDRGQSLDILEIPLAIMDCTLDAYMHLDERQAWTQVTMLVDTVERYSGVLTVLWHNTHLMDEKLKFYERLLAYAAGKNAWLASTGEIYRWWKANDFLGQSSR